MPQTYHQLAACAPSQHEDVYIFAIAPITNCGLAAITSADELVLLNQESLRESDVSRFQNVPTGLTSLAVADQGQTAICAGRDGRVVVFDVRARSSVARFEPGKAINSIACRLYDVVLGSESVVAVWERRQNRIRWQNTEVNDEITAVNFHPTRNNLLLSGGDDGVVCVFDSQIEEEQDSLLQAVNHGPIHKAGFLGATNLYALSSDQNLALHSMTVDDVDQNAEETPLPDQLGDQRLTVPCEYVIDVIQSGHDHVVACGSHSYSRVDLVQVNRGVGLNLEQRIVLEGAHGGEVVRSVCVDDETGTIFTAGEDGRVAAFRPQDSVPSTPVKSAKVKKVSDQRADNPTIRLNAKYDWHNVEIKDGHLVLKQRGFSQTEVDAYATVSIAGVQSRRVDMLHGSYRTVFKVEGFSGGACAGFFWYHDDRSEIDIELVTDGTSLVSNTISFTSHPSLAQDGQPIPDATMLKSLNDSQFRPEIFREYRFDSHLDLGVEYYVDGNLIHTNTRNVPTEGMGGSLQFKMWADNNKWWSGRPSTTDVSLSIKSIVAYFNTSMPDPDWLGACAAAGGPSQKTICVVE